MEEFKNMKDIGQISDKDIADNDVEGSGNPLKGSVADNQAVFDRLPKLIASKVNALIGVVNNIKNFFIAHLNDSANPHKVTASQVKSDSDSSITAESHINSKENPHKVTKEQVGLDNVDNTSDEDKPVSNAVKNFVYEQEAAFRIPFLEDLNGHKDSEANPHNVTKEQVGLSNVDNTADMDKPVSNAAQKVFDKFNKCASYRKIFERTLEEGEPTTFKIETDLEKNVFNLDGVAIHIQLPESIVLPSTWRMYANGTVSEYAIFYMNTSTSNKGKNYFVKAERLDSDMWWNIKYDKLAESAYNAPLTGNYTMPAVSYINVLHLYLPSAPVGTRIRIFGKEAIV